MTASSASKEHEKSRLEGQLDSLWRWLVTMPLSAGGHERNLCYIHDFSLLLAHIGCPPNSLVLEIGSGSCWATEWLARLGFKVVSLDINLDMLRVGTERFQAHLKAFPDSTLAGHFTVGDGEFIPFRSESFDAVFSLNSLHHIPDIPLVLKEVHRILREGGRFVFIEPGKGHSEGAEAKREMEEHGILEQDIIVETLHSWARDAGFNSMNLVPSVDPKSRLSYDDWRKLHDSGWVTRLLHLRKWGKTLADWSMRHPAGVLIKGIVESEPGHLSGEIVSLDLPSSVHAREMFRIEGCVKNTGTVPWLCWQSFLASHPLNQGEGGYIALGLKLQRKEGCYAQMNFGRGNFQKDIAPGETATVASLAKAPRDAGEYIIKADLVQEGVVWFEDLGGAPLQKTLLVRPADEAVYPDSRIPDTLRAEIVIKNWSGKLPDPVTLSVRNAGDTLWLSAPREEPGIPSHARGYVRLGVQILTSSHEILDRNYQHVSLSRDLPPGEAEVMSFNLDNANLPGEASFFKLDMVDEGISWFEDRGSTPLVLPLNG